MSTVLASNLAGPSSTVTAATLASINGGPIAGERNRIINGGMDIWQRGTSTTNVGTAYLADRWAYQFTTGGTVSQETSSLPTGSRYAWKYVASASNTYLQTGQQIEYINCLDLQNTTVAISFMARAVTSNVGSTALTVRTRTIAGVDGACIFVGSAADTAITLTTAWTRYTVTRTLPSTFGSLSLEFALGSHVSGDGIMLSPVQLEPGAVATPFERRSYGLELALCQRYYETGDGNITGYTSGGIGNTNTVYFKAIKRATPTLAYAVGSVVNVSTYDIRNATTSSAQWFASVSSGGPFGFIWTGTWTANSEL